MRGDGELRYVHVGETIVWADELDRLRQIEAAAREYAESRRAWESALSMATDGGFPPDEWRAIEERQETARTNLLALFASPS